MRTNIYSNNFHLFIISRPGLQWGDLFLELDFLRGRGKLDPLDRAQFFIKHKFELLVLIIISLWSYFAFHNWISDSEFWPITLSGHFDQWRQHPALVYKGFFHITLGWIYALDLDSAQHIRLAKFTYTFIGAAYFYLFYWIVKKHLEPVQSILFLLVILSSSLGFSQIGVIRSDFLASFLVILYFYWQDQNGSWKKQVTLHLGFTILLLCTTPKSIYWVIAMSLHFFLSLNREQKIKWSQLILTLVILSLGLITFLDQVYFQSQIFNSFYLAWQHNSELQKTNLKLNDWFFLKPYLVNDVALLILTSGLLIFSLLPKKISWADRSFVLIATIALLMHEPHLPFFVGSFLFVILLKLSPLLNHLKSTIRVSLFLFVIVLNLVLAEKKNYYFSNEIQLKSIQTISNFLDSHSYSVIDGLGLFPRVEKLDLTYIGPFDPVANQIFLKKIINTRPDFVVYSGRFLNLEPEISKFLGSEYTNVGNGYWLRKDLPVPDRLITVLPGYYFNYRPSTFLEN